MTDKGQLIDLREAFEYIRQVNDELRIFREEEDGKWDWAEASLMINPPNSWPVK